MRVANLADVIAGRVELVALEVMFVSWLHLLSAIFSKALSTLCKGLDGKPLEEVYLCDNALGEKGVIVQHLSVLELSRACPGQSMLASARISRLASQNPFQQQWDLCRMCPGNGFVANFQSH